MMYVWIEEFVLRVMLEHDIMNDEKFDHEVVLRDDDDDETETTEMIETTEMR
jgi:hypothetical protein